ncbi:MAG: phosphoribosylanthranilate isomerase [Pseudoramibacter sp.]
MSTRIKLCGMMRDEDIEMVNAVKPDMIGFIFAEKSRRYISREKALRFKAQLSPEIRAVGVFVDAAPETMAACVREGVIDGVQLHGHETNATIQKLRELIPETTPVLQAAAVRNADDVKRAEASAADLILLDAKGGGSGKTFNWELAQNVSRPYLLAGGLSLENIEEALKTLSPWGVDVSSGIETDGMKDVTKIQRFVDQVRKYDQMKTTQKGTTL